MQFVTTQHCSYRDTSAPRYFSSGAEIWHRDTFVGFSVRIKTQNVSG